VRLVKVVHDWPGAILVPPASLKVDLEAPAENARPDRTRRVGLPASTSWWTARATAGEVTAGFTKEEILRKPETDPRGEGGMFARLEGLLRALR
jgi:hypothetical protein